MKKYLIFILIIVMLVTTVSCSLNGLEKKYEINTTIHEESSYSPSDDEQTTFNTNFTSPESFNSTTDANQAIIDTISVDNETPYEKLITKTCDIHYVVEKYFTEYLYGDTNLTEIAADIGVECLRKTNAYDGIRGGFYSVHKVKQGGLLYIFYTNSPKNNSRDVIQWFYVQKDLSYNDFKTIKDGSTINDVKKVDPTAQIFENILHANLNANPDFLKGKDDCYLTLHCLSDGYLEIYYGYKNGKLIVTRQNFVEDFMLRQHNVSKAYAYNGKILPMDRIE